MPQNQLYKRRANLIYAFLGIAVQQTNQAETLIDNIPFKPTPVEKSRFLFVPQGALCH